MGSISLPDIIEDSMMAVRFNDTIVFVTTIDGNQNLHCDCVPLLNVYNMLTNHLSIEG